MTYQTKNARIKHLIPLLELVERRIQSAEAEGLICPRCDGMGICNHIDHWRLIVLGDENIGKICFRCKGIGRLRVKPNPNRKPLIQIAFGIWHDLTKTGKVHFGEIVNWYRTTGQSAWNEAIKPLVSHLHHVALTKALRQEDKLEFVPDDMVWDPRCYSFIRHAQGNLAAFYPNKLDDIASGKVTPIKFLPKGE